MSDNRSYLRAVAAIVAVCFCVVSCSHKADPIPRGKLSKIYAEMFMLDQHIEYQRNLGYLPDTTMVYEAVLEKYGYTWENYLASQDKYIKDPERYSRIIKKAVAILTEEQKALEKEKQRIDDILNAKLRMKLFAPHRIYLMDTLVRDTLGNLDPSSFGFNFDFQLGLDTVFAGPRIIVAADTASVQKDSLTVCSDSAK